MAQPLVLGVAVVLLLLGLLVLRRALDQARVTRTVRDLAVTPIRPPATGLQRVRGRLAGDPLLRSPYQGRECVYYFFRVTEPREGKRPRVLATGKEWSLATIEDGSGRAALEPWTPAVGSPRRFETVLRGLTEVPPGLEGFFERAGIDPKHLPRLPLMVVHEYTLEPGDEVHVLGTQRVEAGGATFHRAKHRPYVVSAEADVGLLPGLRHQWIVFASVAPMLLAAGLTLLALALWA